jgi:flagellar biosynthesis protein FlhG
MSDQADSLRQLVRTRREWTEVAFEDPPDSASVPRQGARSLVFTSGKGGVGTSNIALNLAIALGELGQRVVLIDADFGLANLDLLCGLTPHVDLGDVLAGRCTLADAVAAGPASIRIIPGAHAIRTGREVLEQGPARLVAELADLESSSDFVLVDAGSGLDPRIATLGAAAERVVVVTTAEPTSVADAYAAIARFRRLPSPPSLRVLVNQAASVSEADIVLDHLISSSRQFLGAVVAPLGTGYVRRDPHVQLAVRGRRPFVSAYSQAAATRGIFRLARMLIKERRPGQRGRRPGFFMSLAARWALNRVAR